MTQEAAQQLYNTEFWKDMSHFQRATFQLNEERLCMPFGVFHEAVEKALGRHVQLTEFAFRVDELSLELDDCAVPE
jgi:hypothetical protein